jgi:general secretion pathway protein K
MQLKQRGSVIIVTLWTITVMTILVAVIASQNRLSAQAAYFHQQDIDTWAKVLAAINQAEMDVVLEQMMPPVREIELSSTSESFSETLNALQSNLLYRFNGEKIQLNYPQPDDIAVRIYSHAGKINIRELSRPRLRAMIEKQLGGPVDANQQQIDAMMEAWNDWLDLNDGASVIGAEVDYYQEQDTPYRPRNGSLETVEEILLIRGFAEVFGDVDLDAAFTIYGEDDLINLNLATVEAMRLLPGLDDELIEKIVAYRQEKEFQGNGDVAQIVPPEKMTELRSWLNSRKTDSHYTIMVYKEEQKAETDESAEEGEDEADEEDADSDRENMQTAYAEIVYAPTQTNRPQILKVNPYQRIPEELHIVADSETEEEDPE